MADSYFQVKSASKYGRARAVSRLPRQKGPGPSSIPGSPGGPAEPPPDLPLNLIPPDPAAEAAKNTARRNVALTDAAAAWESGNLRSEYGLTDSGSFDPTNPYSRAALLQESFKRSKLSNTNSYAAQGQLYSGALQNAQDESARNYNIGEDALIRAFLKRKGEIKLGQLGSYADSTSGIDEATFQALLKAL